MKTLTVEEVISRLENIKDKAIYKEELQLALNALKVVANTLPYANWIDDGKNCKATRRFSCSSCGKRYGTKALSTYKCCPYCGARMVNVVCKTSN